MIKHKLLFFDIETTTQTELCQDLPISLLRQFEKIYDKYQGKYSSIQEAYQNEGPLNAEFAKIVCVSIGFIKDNGEVKIQNFNIKSDDERMMLIKLREVFDKVFDLGYYLSGNNIKNFDIPFLGKRYLINGLLPPKHFPSYDSKPWDLKILDLKDIWSFGKFGTLFNTDLICTVMDIPTPKDEMDGSKVYIKYYNGLIDDIIKYCNKDVEAIIELYNKFKHFD